MPIQKITETETSSSPSPDTHFLVTQPESNEAGKLVESLRRIGADDIANMFKKKFGLGDTAKEIASLKEDIDHVNDAIFLKDENKKIEWAPNLMANGETLQKYTNNQTSKPFLLKKGETVKVKTKGNGNYWFNAISRVPSIDSKIEEHSVLLENLVSIDSNQLKEYTYTANETIPLIACTMMDETSSITFSNLKKDSKIEDLSTAVTLLNDNLETLNSDIYENDKKMVEWVSGFVCASVIRTSDKDKVTKPFLLKTGETVKVKTKGDGSYIFDALASVESINTPIVNNTPCTKIISITNNSLNEYTYTATQDIVLVACVLDDATSSIIFENVYKPNKIKKIENNIKIIRTNINDLDNKVIEISGNLYESSEKEIKWNTGFTITDRIIQSNKDKVTNPFYLYQGETVKVKTKSDGSYMFAWIGEVDSINTVIAPQVSIANGQNITDNTLTEYTYTATEDKIIVVCVLDDATSSIIFENIKTELRTDVMREEIDDIKTRNLGSLIGKSVMFFGDSLTSAYNQNIYGFANIIADRYHTEYALFVYDSADGNTQDIPSAHARFTNYAKDGTTNRNISERNDSVLQRVKRHITADTLVDIVLIECCVNDVAETKRNKGTISASYTDSFDTDTSIGSIEETIRYLTTLAKPIKVGFYIPWTITWADDNFFDDYLAVFKKWGIPCLDLRYTAGFNMHYCHAHRLLYSLSADAYESFDSTQTYNLDNFVKYGGTNYKCLADGVKRVLPTDKNKWMEVSSEASDGTHLNGLGHQIVASKIQNFIESL